MSNIKQLDLGAQHIVYDASRQPDIDSCWFDPDYWREQGCVSGNAQGRASVLFFFRENREYVLRHYHRGGLVSRLVSDRYLWMGLERTRAWREWRMLLTLHEMALPVPVPVAARIQRSGPVYRADLITERVDSADTLCARLTQQTLSAVLWRRIGEVIRSFHDAGADHADLNAHNILLREEQAVYLIDFDRGHLRDQPGRWRNRNLARLQRSLNKLKATRATFHYEQGHWLELMQGYRR